MSSEVSAIPRQRYVHRNHRKMIRLLSFFERFSRGEVLFKKVKAERFGVDEKTIQRDLADLREFIHQFQQAGIHGLTYDHSVQGYRFQRDEQSWLTSPDILFLLELVLGSRCLAKTELDTLWRKLLTHCPPAERWVLEELLSRERAFYRANIQEKNLVPRLWRLGEVIQRMLPVEIDYSGRTGPLRMFVVDPFGITFSGGYFYLIGRILATRQREGISVFRLDLIQNHRVLMERAPNRINDRTRQKNFQKKVMFLQSVSLVNIQFRYWGDSLDHIFAKLPAARIVGIDEDYTLIEVEAQWQGLKGWILAQANNIELLYPEDFRCEIKEIITNMLKIYQK